MLLGAFAAGVITKLLLRDATPHDAEAIESKLEAIGFGFLVPVFFINTGVTFDLRRAAVQHPGAAAAAGVPDPAAGGPRPARAAQRPDQRRAGGQTRHRAVLRHRSADHRGGDQHRPVDTGDLPAGTASALVGAGMLSVLLFPLLALGQHRKAPDGAAKPPDVDAARRRGGLSRRRQVPWTGDQVPRVTVPSSPRLAPSPRTPRIGTVSAPLADPRDRRRPAAPAAGWSR